MLFGLAMFVGGLVATPVAITLLRRRGVLDVPNHRSSHERETVRGAGVGVALIGVGLLLLASRTQSSVALVATTTAAFAIIGLSDDLAGLSVKVRLPLQTFVAVVMLAAMLVTSDPGSMLRTYGLFLAPVAVFGLIAYVNAFNFMDGIDGISSLHAAAVGATWLTAGLVSGLGMPTLLGAVIVGGSLGFLPFNLPAARGFLGDVGSYYFGGLIATSAIVLVGVLPFFVIIAPLTPYAIDTAATLLRRVRRGETWHTAHREHAYQRIVAAGWSHGRTALLMGILTLVSGLSALAIADALTRSTWWLLAFTPTLLALLGYLALPRIIGSDPLALDPAQPFEPRR